METNYEDKDVDLLSKLQEEFERLDGYTIQSKSEEILEGLGFTTDDLSKPLRLFSGGWRMRVMLAKLLLQKPALLLLDEPTNHLDLPSIEWVEKYIHDYEGSVVVVSHDRYFLDRTVDNIAEVSNAKITLYPGNFSFYEEEKALRNVDHKKLLGAILYVVRYDILTEEDFMNSKPCKRCTIIIEKYMKKFGLKKVYYTI
jgi:ATP-binding cassette subfamily F protein 3